MATLHHTSTMAVYPDSWQHQPKGKEKEIDRFQMEIPQMLLFTTDCQLHLSERKEDVLQAVRLSEHTLKCKHWLGELWSQLNNHYWSVSLMTELHMTWSHLRNIVAKICILSTNIAGQKSVHVVVSYPHATQGLCHVNIDAKNILVRLEQK